MSFIIQNHLEVLSGDVIMIPGMEPASSHSSVTLTNNIPPGKASISLKDALATIPGSTVKFLSNYGTYVNGGRKYFVLPDGPPSAYGCTGCTINDWYEMLRSRTTESSDTQSGVSCDAFDWKSCDSTNRFR